MCVKFSGYSYKGIIRVGFMAGISTKDWLHYFPWGPKYLYVASIFFLNSEHPFCKKANLLTCDALTDFFWNFYGKLEGVKVANVHLKEAIFCG